MVEDGESQGTHCWNFLHNPRRLDIRNSYSTVEGSLERADRYGHSGCDFVQMQGLLGSFNNKAPLNYKVCVTY